MKVNNLPTLTWNFLKLNNIECDTDGLFEKSGGVKIDIKNRPGGLIVETSSQKTSDIIGGMGKEADELLDKTAENTLYICAPKGLQAEEPIRIDFDYGSIKAGVVKIIVEAREESKVNIILNHIGEEAAGQAVGSDLRVEACASSMVRVVNTNLLGKKSLCFENIGARVGERADLGFIHMELGSEKTYLGVNVDLAGYKASFEGNAGYLVRGDELLDINYMINHIARKTVSSLMVKGALKDRAVKNFRGTIDLRRGAKGAVGDEQEETLLLSEGVKNKTLPVILCDEEDVEGTHGASIGKLSEDVLFYMTSRGISEAEAEVLMTRAKLDSIRRLIDDEESQGRIQHYLEKSFS